VGVSPVTAPTEHTRDGILTSLVETYQSLFGFEVTRTVPIVRGWLNLKWRIHTTDGTYLLKYYNPHRLKHYDLDDLIETFKVQNELAAVGIPCPRMLTSGGNILHQTPNGEQFTAMTFSTGHLIAPGHVTSKQAASLGRAVARFHTEIQRLRPVSAGSKPAFQVPTKAQRQSHWRAMLTELRDAHRSDIVAMVEQQLEATAQLDWPALANGEVGFAHRDLWVDNLLFQGDELTAILDWDRMKIDFLAFDIGRAVMSIALDEADVFHLPIAEAFVRGYQAVRPLPGARLDTALQGLWAMESTWWVHTSIDEQSPPPRRFRQEMLWLARHINELPELA
jgi:homoserine kinase type II